MVTCLVIQLCNLIDMLLLLMQRQPTLCIDSCHAKGASNCECHAGHMPRIRWHHASVLLIKYLAGIFAGSANTCRLHRAPFGTASKMIVASGVCHLFLCAAEACQLQRHITAVEKKKKSESFKSR